MHRVLIVGASSLVGKGLINYYVNSNISDKFKIYITIRNNLNTPIPDECIYYLDIMDDAKVTCVLNVVEPDIIIFIAGEGSIDYCEKNKEIARKINIDALNNFIDIIENHKSHFMYLSSNAVFDGKGAPYNETSHPNPINYYGKLKFEAETIVRKRLKNRFTIIRPVLLLGISNKGRRQSAVEFFLYRLYHKERVRAVDDVFNNPLHTNYLADGIWKIIEKLGISKNEIFHFGGRDRLSRYDLIVELSEYFGFNSDLVDRVDSSAFPHMTKRMPDTTYDTTKAQKMLNWVPPSINQSFEILKIEFDRISREL